MFHSSVSWKSISPLKTNTGGRITSIFIGKIITFSMQFFFLQVFRV